MVDKKSEHRNRSIQKTNFWSVFIDLILSIGKTLAGILYHSQALIVDGVHSFSDLVSDLFVIWITRLSNEAPDEDHPYGHARFETVGTVVFGLFLTIVAIGFGYDGIRKILDDEVLQIPAMPALIVAIVAIAAKELLYRFTLKMGEKLNSKLLLANAWHHRSDVLSTIVVIVGISGAMNGYPKFDAYAALVVAIMIAWVGIKLIWESLTELVDTSPFAGDIDNLTATISQVKGVIGVHELRSRKMGPNTLLDAHIQVPSYVSVSEGHQIGDWVAEMLHRNYKDISEVIVHIDAEDDLSHPDKSLRPMRNEIQPLLESCWSEILQPSDILSMSLHYLKGKIKVDIILSIDLLQEKKVDAETIESELDELAKHFDWYDNVRVLFTPLKNRQKWLL